MPTSASPVNNPPKIFECLASETLARARARGRLVALKARVGSKGRGLAGPGRSLVSMVLTSKAHRRRTPGTNRRIPTIPTGCFDGRIVHVSTVDTRPRRSESGGSRWHSPVPPPQVHPPTAPCPLRRGPDTVISNNEVNRDCPLPCWWSRVVRGWASCCGHGCLAPVRR